MSIGWFDGEIKPASWFHPIAAGGIFDETLIAQSGGSGAITGTLESADAAVGGGHSKSKAVYVKRGENIMVFRDADAADSWLTNEKEAEKAHKHGKPYRPRKPKPLDAKSWQALEIPKIANLASRFKEQEAFTRHLAAENWEALAAIYDHLRQREEEEILAVLLAA